MKIPQILEAERSLKRERKWSYLNDKTSTRDRKHLSSIPEESAGNSPDAAWREWSCGWTGAGAGNRCGETIILPENTTLGTTCERNRTSVASVGQRALHHSVLHLGLLIRAF